MTSESPSQREALIALLLVLLPNLVLTGAGLLMRGPAQQVTAAQAVGHFGPARLLRMVSLYAFLLLPTAAWLCRPFVVRHAAPAECRTPLRLRLRGLLRACGWRREQVGRAFALGAVLGAGALLLRARPFAPERLAISDTWWALAAYAVVASAEETLYRGFLQGRLEDWLGRW